MMDYKLKSKAAGIITENLLTPIIYLRENGDETEFVCFFDPNTENDTMEETVAELRESLGLNAELVDMRDLDLPDRIMIMNEAEVIYTAHPMFEDMMTQTLVEDIQKSVAEKIIILSRYDSTGNVYLQ